MYASPQCQHLIPVCVSSYFRFAEVKQKLENTTSKYVLVKDATLRPPSPRPTTETKHSIRITGMFSLFVIPPSCTIPTIKVCITKLQANGLLDGDLMDESEFDIEKHDAAFKGHHFFKYLHELWGHVRENIDPNPIVINTQDLLENPKRVLSRFCELTGLPYRDSLLQWDASSEVVKHWRVVGDNIMSFEMSFYGRAINSSMFFAAKCTGTSRATTRRCDSAGWCFKSVFFKDMNQHKII